MIGELVSEVEAEKGDTINAENRQTNTCSLGALTKPINESEL
jgi:hypothetical protein